MARDLMTTLRQALGLREPDTEGKEREKQSTLVRLSRQQAEIEALDARLSIHTKNHRAHR